MEPEVARPRVTLKYAQTLDGRIATSTGQSRWISGPESRKMAHRLRAEHDAILVGVGTVLADDPLLSVRLVEGRDPLRVVVDGALRTPLSARVLTTSPENSVFVVTGRAPREKTAEVKARGARVLELPERHGQVDLAALLQTLAGLSVGSVLVEGGSQVVTSFLRMRLVDSVVIFIAPKVLGTGVDAIGDLGIRSIDHALTFDEQSVDVVEKDIVFRGRIDWHTA